MNMPDPEETREVQGNTPATVVNREGERPAKRIKTGFRDTIIVLIGASEIKYILHEHLVCPTSDFFRCICNGDQEDSSGHTVRLPEATEEIFEIYSSFIYTRTLDARGEDDSSVLCLEYNRSLTTDVKTQLFNLAIQAYAFGKKMQDAAFRNAMCEEAKLIMRGCEHVGFPENIHTLCKEVSMSSKLTRLFVDWFICASYRENKLDELLEKVPAEFVRTVASLSIRERKQPYVERLPKSRGKCFYHDHKSEADKSK